MKKNTSFLHRVAQDIFARYQNKELDFAKLVVVFPNKRASLFFNKELANISESPIWAPQYQTISDLFLSLSPYTPIDSIPCVCELYRCYQKVLNSNELIDDFYGWGEVLLSDLNDIDKQLVSVDDLFQSIENWNSLTATADFLTEEQVSAIQKYFSSFSPEESDKTKLRFINLWKAMPAIYKSLNDNLKAMNLLYEGALCRDVVENHLDKIDKDKTYVFVGFNVLTKVQEKLLQQIHAQGNALFYWDYDDRLNEKSEGLARLMYDASHFIRHYEKRMPNALSFDNEEVGDVSVNFIKTDSFNAQARYLPHWLADNVQKGDLTNTVVILSDESMLPQVLGTLPEEAVNITMGYKLIDTPVYSFISSLIDLQLKGVKSSENSDSEQVNRYFYNSFFMKVRNHPFTPFWKDDEDARLKVWNRKVEGENASQMLDYLDDNLLAVLAEVSGRADETHFPLYAEALYRAHLVVEKLQKMNLGLGRDLTCSLLMNMLRTLSVPFHGEPVEGVQVMGMLETRSLDFENILILSANDGTLPRSGHITSLIPYCLREYAGLTTEKQQVNIYAYNFFRLLQRARKVTMMFAASDMDSSKCEMSRFMRQLLAETDLPIATQHLDFSPVGTDVRPPAQIGKIDKTEEVARSMASLGSGKVVEVSDEKGKSEWKMSILSPSAINTYQNCPLQYYYKYVAKINVQEDFSSTLAANQFGTVFHKAAEVLYSALMKSAGSNRITPEMLQNLSKNQIDAAVDEAFRTEIFEQPFSEVRDYTGELVIARKVVREYLWRLVRIDQKLAPFRILQMEKRHYAKIKVEVCGKEQDLYIGGVIDRLDYIEHHPKTDRPAIRIVDYKTGGKQERDSQIGILGDLFDGGNRYVFQTFLYSLAIMEELHGSVKMEPHIEAQNGGPIQLSDSEKTENIMPSIVFIREANGDTYDACLQTEGAYVNDFELLASDFKEKLTFFLSKKMLNPDENFERTAEEEHCTYCDYRLLCGM